MKVAPMVEIKGCLNDILNSMDAFGVPYHFVRHGEPGNATVELCLSVDGGDPKLEIYLRPDGTYSMQAPLKLA